MLTISILSQKGGAGKTTLAVNLAGAAGARRQQVCIIDLDPQASARGWYDHRQRDSPAVISTQARMLPESLRIAAAHGADLVLIDTAPQSETAALAAAKAADLVLIPCRPCYFDIKAIETTVDLVRLAGKPALFVLNCIRPGDKSLPDGAEAALEQYGWATATARISQRAAFVHSLTHGQTVAEYEPQGAAAREIQALLSIAMQQASLVAH